MHWKDTYHLNISQLRFEALTKSQVVSLWTCQKLWELPVLIVSSWAHWPTVHSELTHPWPQVFSNKSSIFFFFAGPVSEKILPCCILTPWKKLSGLTRSFLGINQFIWPLVLSYPFTTPLLILLNLIICDSCFLFNVCSFYLGLSCFITLTYSR